MKTKSHEKINKEISYFNKQQGREYDEALMPHVRPIIKYYNMYDVYYKFRI